MQVEAASIPDVKLVTPKKIGDARGFFSEVYSRRAWAEAGLDCDFVQDNHSYTSQVGVIRGLHFQTAPFAQAKLVRVVRGRVRDVAVDLRRGSPTFGHHVAVELSADSWSQLLVPIGFAHGFCTLTPDCEVLYKVTNVYSAAHDRGLAFDDPALQLDWGVDLAKAVLSERDRKHPRLADLGPQFS